MPNIETEKPPVTNNKRKRGVFGWDPVKLYMNYRASELVEMSQALMADPQNRNPDHLNGNSIYIYKKSARKKLDALTWAITYHLADKKAQAASQKNETRPS